MDFNISSQANGMTPTFGTNAYAVAAGTMSKLDSGNVEDAEARKVAEDFAGFFIGQVYKMMRATVEEGEFGHGGSAEKMFQDLSDDEIGNTTARGNGFGLTEMIYKSLRRRQGISAYTQAAEGAAK